MEKPFIHLLRSPYACYFFDVNTNSIVMVSEEGYAALQEIVKTGSVPSGLSEACRAELQRLQTEGYLSSKKVQEIEHPLTRDLDYILSRKVRKITLQLTQSCNLRCAYCIYSETTNERQRTHSAKRMSWETAKAGIDFLLEHSIDSERVNVGFYGGEPLLEFDLLKKATLYAEKCFEGKDLTFGLTSNATLLTDEIIEFFAEHNILLLVSLDGPKSIHDRSRCFANGGGTFDTVMGNLQRLVEKYPKYAPKVSINMVVDPQNDYDCLNDFIVDYDIFKTINAQASPLSVDYSGKTIVYSEDYRKEVNYDNFLAYLQHFDRIKTMPVPALAKKSIEQEVISFEKKYPPMKQLPDKCMHGGPCIPGQGRLFINAYGDFYPCERVSELSDTVKIGNLETGYNLEKAKKLLNIGQLSPEECKNCWAFFHCATCARSADGGADFDKKAKMSRCGGIRSTIEQELRGEIMRREIKGGLLK